MTNNSSIFIEPKYLFLSKIRLSDLIENYATNPSNIAKMFKTN